MVLTKASKRCKGLARESGNLSLCKINKDRRRIVWYLASIRKGMFFGLAHKDVFRFRLAPVHRIYAVLLIKGFLEAKVRSKIL
jgi:hypothetical protein